MFFAEYGLLIAVSLPVLVIVVIQLLLFASGERGTLLLPSLARFPKVSTDVSLDASEPGQGSATPIPDEAGEELEMREAA